MAPTSQDVLNVLQSIDASLKALVARSNEIARLGAASPAGEPSQAMAAEADLDSKYGDPEVKAKDPREWTGDTQKGKRFSQCPAPYLDLVADRLDYFAGKETDATKARYNRLDASRARGWAARLRNGWKPAEEPSTDGFDSTSIPF